ncbi:MAG: hypothetical protein M3525_12495 [Acidobacteriota bacterium]|nr:hypothetical protein [Acidobacteriota bacterium]
MAFLSSPNARIILFYFILILVTCAPIWSVAYFVNQDGSGHVYSASLMLEILKQNPTISDVFAINAVPVPNSSGHWMLVFLLLFFSPFVATKILVTITYAGFVAAVGWLRIQIVGRSEAGIKTSFLIGAALGFNWLWLQGFYNFIIGVIGFLIALGFFFRRREGMNLPRCLILSLLVVFVYFSHLISFAFLAGGVFVITCFVSRPNLKRTLIYAAIAFLPVAPLLISYKYLSGGGGGFSPVWRNLANPYSIASWITQIRAADPFVIISRKTFPFSPDVSAAFAIFTPLLWLFAAFALLAVTTWIYYRKQIDSLKPYFPFVVLAAGSLLIAVFAPDDFTLTHGGIIRQRFLLCGLLFFVVLFRFGDAVRLKRAAQFCLVFVVVFQTAALWDYALYSNKISAEFFSASKAIDEGDSIASVVVVDREIKFSAYPIRQTNNYNGIGRNNLVLDNYELGYYLFPVIARNNAHRQFVFDFTENNMFYLNQPNSKNFDDNLRKLEATLAADNDKIDTLILWDTDARVERILSRWFEDEPYFQNGRVRLFRHR